MSCRLWGLLAALTFAAPASAESVDFACNFAGYGQKTDQIIRCITAMRRQNEEDVGMLGREMISSMEMSGKILELQKEVKSLKEQLKAR